MITGFNIASEGAQVLLKRVKMTPLKRVQELLIKVTSALTCGHPGVVGWMPLPGWVLGTEPQSCGGPVEVGFRMPSDMPRREADFDKLVISLKTLKAVSDNLSPSLVESGFTFTRICELSDGTAAGDDTLAAVIDFCSASRAPIPVDDKLFIVLYNSLSSRPPADGGQRRTPSVLPPGSGGGRRRMELTPVTTTNNSTGVNASDPRLIMATECLAVELLLVRGGR
jgi:hypothetical protein